jgi:2-polyprenyl-6-methoxyphenol hydroxylase-like FAD-dependent oxidoreductase
MTPPIAILGAGPSGLALGRFLEVANIAYVIFERDESATWAIGRGGTLDLHAGSGQLALQEAGLLDQFKSLARYDATNTIADAKGTVYARFEPEGGDQDRPEIDRKDLRALLLSSIPANRVCWGRRVQHVQRDTDGSMSVHFTDGSIESGFRLVVGADGTWSKARSLVSQNATTHAYLISAFD